MPESKLSKRTVYFQELSPDLTVNNISFNGKILQRNVRTSDALADEIVVCFDTEEEFKKELGQFESNPSAIAHHSVKVKDIDGVDPSDMDRVRKGVEFIGSAFSEAETQIPRYGISLAGHQISSHAINPKFFTKHLQSQKLVSFKESVESQETVVATAHSGSVSLNLELGRLSNPIQVDSSFKVMFNEVDGL